MTRVAAYSRVPSLHGASSMLVQGAGWRGHGKQSRSPRNDVHSLPCQQCVCLAGIALSCLIFVIAGALMSACAKPRFRVGWALAARMTCQSVGAERLYTGARWFGQSAGTTSGRRPVRKVRGSRCRRSKRSTPNSPGSENENRVRFRMHRSYTITSPDEGICKFGGLAAPRWYDARCVRLLTRAAMARRTTDTN